MVKVNQAVVAETVATIREDLEKRGYGDILLVRSGSFIHVTAQHLKKNKGVNVYAQPFQQPATK